MKEREFSLVLSLVLCAFFLCGTVACAASFNFWSVFPDEQGEHGVTCGVFVQPGNGFYLMADLGEYVFGTEGIPGNRPRLERSDAPWILADPLKIWFPGGEYRFAPVLAKTFSQSVTVTEVSGTVKALGQGSIRFVVSPRQDYAWYEKVIGPGEEVNFSLSPGEKVDTLFFLVFPEGYSMDYRALVSANVDYVPLPASLCLFGLGLVCFSIIRGVRTRVKR